MAGLSAESMRFYEERGWTSASMWCDRVRVRPAPNSQARCTNRAAGWNEGATVPIR